MKSVICPYLRLTADFFSQTANGLIIQAFRKRISQVNVVYHCGNSDQMALPSVDFLNPLPLGLFVLTCSFVRLTCYFWGTKNGLSLPKSPFCYQSIISPSTAQLCVFVTLTLCIVPISDSSPFTSVMMNSPLLPLISPSL